MLSYPKEVLAKASLIKLVTFDCDGVLTDGSVHYSPGGQVSRVFNAADGQGLKKLRQEGFIVAIITASQSSTIEHRAKDLGLDHLYLGSYDKNEAFEELKTLYDLSFEQMCHMGDDWPDYPLIEKAGFGVTVPKANLHIQQAADYCTKAQGGHGAARELADLLIYAK